MSPTTPKERRPGSGSWRVEWRTDGKKQVTTWPDEKLAWKAYEIAKAHQHRWTDEQVYEAILGKSDSPTSAAPLFADFFAVWIPTKTAISPGVRAQYHQQFRDHLDPTFGKMHLDLIKAGDIGGWINKRREAGVKNTTITREFALLFQILEAAMHEGHIARNPCRLTDFKRDRKEDDTVESLREKFLTFPEFERAKAEFDERWHPLLEFLWGTGARWSEATAITIGHIVHPTTKDPVAKVRIWQAWKRDGKGGYYLGPTKGREKRSVPIDKDLYELLLAVTKGRKPTEFIFPNAKGERLHYSSFWNKVWTPAMIAAQRCSEHPPPRRESKLENHPSTARCRDYGGKTSKGTPCGGRLLTGFDRCREHVGPEPDAVSTCDCPGPVRLEGEVYGPHLLRHSFATALLNQGVARIRVAKLMGHADPRTTDRYGHVIDDDDAVLEAMAAARKRQPDEK